MEPSIRGLWARATQQAVWRDAMAGGLVWAAVAMALSVSRAVRTPDRLAVDATVGFVIVLAVAGRHIHRLATRLRAAEEDAESAAHRATHDPLTGLANRTLMFEQLHLDLRRLRRTGGIVVVAYLDVDDLKIVNDTFGHATGDLVLQSAAQRLSAAVREVDTVARISGDEFVVVCMVEESESANRLIERLRSAAEPPLHPEGGGLSFGWVVTTDADADPGDVLAKADEAMYRDKVRRRGERGSVWWLSRPEFAG